jgi:protein-S-isoprenylcysteine O-methyltransferase Ste14
MTDERGADVRVPPPLVFLALIIIGVGLSYIRPLESHLSLVPRLTIAIALAAASIALFLSSLSLFRRTGQDPKPWEPTPSLLIQGPYRFTRNPIYVAMTLLQLAIGVARDNMWIVLFALPALAIVHFAAVLPEEAYLSEKFGDSYRQYLRSVRRYL